MRSMPSNMIHIAAKRRSNALIIPPILRNFFSLRLFRAVLETIAEMILSIPSKS